jgi:hypothetical protein
MRSLISRFSSRNVSLCFGELSDSSTYTERKMIPRWIKNKNFALLPFCYSLIRRWLTGNHASWYATRILHYFHWSQELLAGFIYMIIMLESIPIAICLIFGVHSLSAAHLPRKWDAVFSQLSAWKNVPRILFHNRLCSGTYETYGRTHATMLITLSSINIIVVSGFESKGSSELCAFSDFPDGYIIGFR